MIENKYSRLYVAITTRAFNRIPENGKYYEIHHIQPKALGGLDTPENLCYLTPKEHYICHHLLTKCTEGTEKRSMLHAWLLMAYCDRDGNRYIPAVRYAFLRKQLALVGKSEEHKAKIGAARLGKKRAPFTEEAKKSMSEARRKNWAEGKYTNEHAKKPKSEETKRRMADAARKRHEREREYRDKLRNL